MQLKEPSLLKTDAYINGAWLGSAQRFPVTDPYNGQVLAKVADLDKDETENAVKAAATAFETWSKKAASDRATLLKRWYELQIAHQDDLARILSMEQGKPLAEAKTEIVYGASFIEWFAEEARRGYGDVIPGHGRDKRILTIKQPIGVVAAITPWNFPNAMITRKAGPALAAGCTFVVKPSDQTPLSALALAELADQAGIPPGVFNVVPSTKAQEVGEVLTTHPLVRKFTFTGSTRVGKILTRQCADTVKKVSMELGGNAPFIVFDDADLESAVSGAMAAKYRNAGQTCVAANRIYAQDGIYEAFVEKFAEASRGMACGYGLDDGVDIGPLIDQTATVRLESLLEDALSKGAKTLAEADNTHRKHNVLPPTVLVDAHENMDMSKEEIFGPLAPIYRFNTEDEVIKRANDTPYGLVAYFYTNDLNRSWRLSEALEYGMVGVNTGMISTTVAPFGGVKESGIGREGSKYGMEEYQELKYVCLGGVE